MADYAPFGVPPPMTEPNAAPETAPFPPEIMALLLEHAKQAGPTEPERGLFDPRSVTESLQRATAGNPQKAFGTLLKYPGHAAEGLANLTSVPGRSMQPNPYPAGSEEAGLYDIQRENMMTEAAPAAALAMVGAPGIMPIRGGMTLGSGLIRGSKHEPTNPAAQSQTTPTIRAYHGSPHDFDQFSLDKIGTGEGAQAYGHGLYFAENEGVAKNYRDALSGGDMTVGGKPYNSSDPIHVAAVKKSQYPSTEAAISDLQAQIAQGKQIRGNEDAVKFNQKMLSLIKKGDLPSVQSASQGKMYEVNINADPEHFLDWDAPLKDQHEAVKAALGLKPSMNRAPSGEPFLKSEKLGGWFDPVETTGADVYRNAGSTGSGPGLSPRDQLKRLAAENLNKAGIPGIKYLDQGSRVAGEGSRNYVVFNDKLIDILKKYGLAGLSAGGVGALATGREDKL